MAWVCVDKDGMEVIGMTKPFREGDYWSFDDNRYGQLSIGTIYSLTGKELTWEDEPVELKGE